MNPWKLIRPAQYLHRGLYAIGLGPLIGQIILLLTTTGRKSGKRRVTPFTGRKSGKRRVTPLQYEEIDGIYYLGASRGLKTDWVRNIQADSRVSAQVKGLRFNACAEIITEPSAIAGFLETRLQRHPRMVGLMMRRAHALPSRPSRTQLETLAKTLAVVALHPGLQP